MVTFPSAFPKYGSHISPPYAVSSIHPHVTRLRVSFPPYPSSMLMNCLPSQQAESPLVPTHKYLLDKTCPTPWFSNAPLTD